MRIISYFAALPRGKAILWCYLIWYVNTVVFYFDPQYTIWLSSLGLALIIGIALKLSVSSGRVALPDHWQTFRLFLMPFCVSSFSSLIKEQGYILILPPIASQLAWHVGSCLIFLALLATLRFFVRSGRI